jgi:hypothetical protein
MINVANGMVTMQGGVITRNSNLTGAIVSATGNSFVGIFGTQFGTLVSTITNVVVLANASNCVFIPSAVATGYTTPVNNGGTGTVFRMNASPGNPYVPLFDKSVTMAGAVMTAVAPTVAASQVGFGSTVATTVGAAGAATALPANPLGYLIANVAGTAVKIPYYNS